MLYSKLLGNPNKTVNGILLSTPMDRHSNKIYLQAKILFNLREKNFKKLFSKKVIKSDFDQSDIEYEESIPERTKLRKQKLREIERKEQNINIELFRKYFTDYQRLNGMYKELNETESAKINRTKVNFIKKILSKWKEIASYVKR